MHRPHLDFIVVGLPRSGTTWVANWLTTDRTLCLHDPFAQGMPEVWPQDARKRGISCTLAPLLTGWLDQFDCPKAVLLRSPSERHASLRAMGLDPAVPEASLAGLDAIYFPYVSLWQERPARALWQHLLPDEPFDAIRYRQLVRMQVQPHPTHWTMDATVLSVLKADGYLTDLRNMPCPQGGLPQEPSARR